MKILLVSDIHHFSTLDVFNGYREAFKYLKVDFETCDIHKMVSMNPLIAGMTIDGAYAICLAKMLNVENEFTHILFLSGLKVPQWVYRSKYDKKIGVIALDDPHASKTLLKEKPFIDYYFTNEKTLENTKNNIFYVPTATTHILPKSDNVLDSYNADVLFVGTIYKNRIEALEKLCKYCEEKNKKILVLGPVMNLHKDSILRKYCLDAILDNDHTKLSYKNSMITINIDRDVNWSSKEEGGNSELVLNTDKPYSINPRAYEIAICKSTQLYIDARQEAYDIFGDNIFYASTDNCVDVLDKIFKTDKNVLEDKKNRCFEIVKNEHLYINRAEKIINILRME